MFYKYYHQWFSTRSKLFPISVVGPRHHILTFLQALWHSFLYSCHNASECWPAPRWLIYNHEYIYCDIVARTKDPQLSPVSTTVQSYKQFVTKINKQHVEKEISTELVLKSSKKKCNAVNIGWRRSTEGWEDSVPYTCQETVKNNSNLKSSHDKISLL